MQVCRGRITALVIAALTLAGSPAFGKYQRDRTPIVPVPWFMFFPDLRVESITASVMSCNDLGWGAPTSVVKFTVIIRNSGHKIATIPKYGTDSWARMVAIDDLALLPPSAKWPSDLKIPFWEIPAGKAQTWEEPMTVPYAPSKFGAWSAGVRVWVDPDNVIEETDELNNYTEKKFWFPVC
jgi:hypothetical protein